MSDAYCWFRADVYHLGRAIETKYDAQGETFSEKVACLKDKVPKKIFDGLTVVARAYERGQSGDIPTDDELMQCKLKIDAYYHFVEPRNRVVNWIVWGVLVAIVIYASWRFLPR